MTSQMASKDFGLTRLSYFDVAASTVRVEFCLATGQQQVFVGYRLVSSLIGWRRRTEHHFDIAGQPYQLVCQTLSYWRMQVRLELRQAERLIDYDQLDFRRGADQQHPWWYWLAFKGLAAVGAGVAVGMQVAIWWLS